jgi:hypothetical protein
VPLGHIRQRLCKQAYAPPYQTALKAFCFVLKGDAAAIQANVIEPTLAQDFKAASLVEDVFALAWIHYDNFSSMVVPDNTHGMHCYQESAVLHLVQDAGKTENDVYLYVPSLYVDSSAAMSSGYTFGFPKAFGEVTMSGTAPNGSGVRLATHADEVKQFQTPSMLAQRLRVYEATPGDPGLARFVHIHNPAPGAVHEFSKLLDHEFFAFAGATNGALLHSIKQFVDAMVFWRAPLLLLKQIPSAMTPLGQAAYQAYVKVNAQVNAVHQVALLGGYTVVFEDWDSSPFVRAYGLSNPPTARRTSNPLTPLLGFYVDLTAELQVKSETPIS